MKILQNFSIFYGKDQKLLDFQISWDFATEIVEFFRKWFFQKLEKVRKMLEKMLELEENSF